MKHLHLTAAAVDSKKLPSVNIVAYTGGLMAVGSWGVVAIELSGLDLSQPVVLLSDHDPSRENVLGQGVATVRGGELHIDGQLQADNQAVAEIVTAAKRGFAWKASVGIDPVKWLDIRPGQTFTANGRQLVAPARGAIHVLSSRLIECSLVSIAADNNSSVQIAAARKGYNMTFEQWLAQQNLDPATITAEQRAGLQARFTAEQQQSTLTAVADDEAQRLTEIQFLQARHSAENPDRVNLVERLCAAAVKSGAGVRQLELEMLRAMRPTGLMSVVVNHAPAVPPRQLLSACAMLLGGHEAAAVKAYGEQTMVAARRMGVHSLVDLARSALQAEGIEAPSDMPGMLRAAFSTLSLPSALGDAQNKVLETAYLETPSTWRSFCAVRAVKDFKQNYSLRPAMVGELEEVAGDGELKHGSLSEDVITFRVNTFGRMIGISRQDVINDDLSFLSVIPAELGRAGARRVSDSVFETLLGADGDYFSAELGNLLAGADSVLNFGSLVAAITAMRSTTDASGHNLDIAPRVLLVPPSLEAVARALVSSLTVKWGDGDLPMPEGNALQGSVQVVVEPRLANARFTGASSTAWYLFGSPADLPFIVAFLNGQDRPVVEQADQPFNTLGVQYRAYIDFGVSLGDFRAAVRADGV